MNNDTNRTTEYRRLVETSWRRALTSAEAAALREMVSADPALGEDWAREQALTGALGRLPEAPLASNFTARVMQSIEGMSASSSTGSRARQASSSWLDALLRGMGVGSGVNRWLWRGAAAAVLVISGVGSFHHFESAERQALAASVATVSEITALPPDILQDFDAIQALSPAPGADEQLLAVMSQ